MPETSMPAQIDDAHLRKFAGLNEGFAVKSATDLESDQNQLDSTPVNTQATDTTSNTEDAVAQEEIYITTKNRQPLWASPWAKLIFVGSAVLLIILLAGSLLNGFVNLKTQVATQPPPQTNKTPTSEEEANGELQTKVALTTQSQELSNLNQQAAKTKPNTKTKVAKSPVSSSSIPVTTPVPASVPIPDAPQPKIERSRQNSWRQVAKSTPSPQEAKEQSVDPTQRWLAAANVGSYGAISPQNSNGISTDSEERYNQADGSVSAAYAATNDPNSFPSSGSGQSPTNEVMTASRNLPDAEPVVLGRRSPSSTAGANEPYSLGKAPFASNSVNISNSGVQNLAIGTRSKGKLETPVAWSGSLDTSAKQNFLIQLTQPLKASSGAVVVPKGAYLVARVKQATDSGLVQMLAVSVLEQHSEQTIEKPLPEGAVLILGKGGKPLQAKISRPDGGGSNVGQILLSGAASIASLSNQPSYQSVFSGNGFTTTTSSPYPNYLAGLGQGVAQEILQQSQRRQQQSQLLETEPIFILEQGTNVQIFVNQSVSF